MARQPAINAGWLRIKDGSDTDISHQPALGSELAGTRSVEKEVNFYRLSRRCAYDSGSDDVFLCYRLRFSCSVL